MLAQRYNASMPAYALDQPSPDIRLMDPLGFKLEGWVEERVGERLTRIELWVDNQLAGATQHLYDRSEVAEVLNAKGNYRGFTLVGRAPWVFGKNDATCRLLAFYGEESEQITSFQKSWGELDYRKYAYGTLVEPVNRYIHHRGDIYCSGPSAPVASLECLQLVQRYLGAPPLRVLDVGCGVGAYGEPLLQLGYNWLGVEIKDSDCDELTRKGLPHRQTDGSRLPFDDKSFDATLSIEVLEHIEEFEAFLREIRRVTRRRLILSVPNIEVLPYMCSMLAAPWHILEADHKNFFTRSSIEGLLLSQGFSKVEVIPYGVMPLRTPENYPLYYHLLAIADV